MFCLRLRQDLIILLCKFYFLISQRIGASFGKKGFLEFVETITFQSELEANGSKFCFTYLRNDSVGIMNRISKFLGKGR